MHGFGIERGVGLRGPCGSAQAYALRGEGTNENKVDGFLRVVESVQLEMRVLVRRKEGEESISRTATDLDNALRSSLCSSSQFGVLDTAKIAKLTSFWNASARTGNSVRSQDLSLKNRSAVIR